ncbi:TonB-dependent receptor [Runella slithyformis]|uniref:TonB-dependent receptor plug n=1 Tax=Runella slithyformis (strain ATCC 29530 / DSM 19594 / LMG 11500 / NCIMB 11436 / LSU 4) TaxID=761193 RepID=A0A7U3ZIA4_RUNSL|nr:TonB-dependent receptor [Runella slithyformis]AEI47720.1 TonB-dependent receptor plug [Runella slithyformis DSM 19594]
MNLKLLPLLLLFTFEGFAQRIIKMEGTIVDSLSNLPISGVAVSTLANNKIYGQISDQSGHFALFLPAGDHTISFKSAGYVPQWRYLNEKSPDQTLTIYFQKVEHQLEQVIVSTKGYDENIRKPLLGVNQIDIKTLSKIPAAFGELDFLRGIQMLPGVSSVGEASNGVNIRGGTTDQNLILVDNTPIFNPTHMFGLFSVIPPDAISNLNLYKGNVPARFGGRAAAVIDISLKTPDVTKFKMTGGLSLISEKLMVNVPIIKDRLAVYVAARGAFHDFLLPVFSKDLDSVRTRFSEVLGKVFWRVNAKNTISLMGYFSNDYFQTNLLATLPNVVGETTFFEHQTNNYALEWVCLLTPKLDWQTTLSVANYDPTIGTIETAARNKVRLESGVYQKQATSALNYQGKNSKWELGTSFTKYHIKPGILNPGNSTSVNALTLPSEFSQEADVFLDGEISANKHFAATFGLRYSYFMALGPADLRTYQPNEPRDDLSVIESQRIPKGKITKAYGGFEPRLGIRYAPNNALSFKMGYNLMRQYIQIASNTTTPIPTSRWKTSDVHIRPQVSHLITGGLYRSFKNDIYDFTLEGYFRQSENSIDYKPGADFLLQPFPETQLVQGQSKAYGVEVMFSKKKGNFTGWINYTYARTFNKTYADVNVLEQVNNGNWYRANYDRPHSINLSIDMVADKHNSFSFNFVYSTGRPYTEPVGFIEYLNNFYPYFDERNNNRIPSYHRLDLAWHIKNPSMKEDKRWKGDWVFTVYNLYARKNAYSVFFKTENGAARAYKLQIFGAPIVSLAYNFNYE